MRNYFYLIAILYLSCNQPTETSWFKHEIKYWKQEACGFYSKPSKAVIEKDSIQIDELSNKSNLYSKEQAEKKVYAKTNVELLALNSNYTNYELHKYKRCSARLKDSIVIVNFHYSDFVNWIWQMEGWWIDLKILKDRFKPEIKYFSDATSGKKDRRISEIEYAELWMSKLDYEKGDTICGKLKIRGDFYWKEDRKQVSHQILQGSFRAIIE